MSVFTVINVINNTTIQVTPSWRLTIKANDKEIIYKGNLVKIQDIKVLEGQNAIVAKERLQILLQNQNVTLTSAKIFQVNGDDSIVECRVLLNNIDVSYYFPESKVE